MEGRDNQNQKGQPPRRSCQIADDSDMVSGASEDDLNDLFGKDPQSIVPSGQILVPAAKPAKKESKKAKKHHKSKKSHRRHDSEQSSDREKEKERKVAKKSKKNKKSKSHARVLSQEATTKQPPQATKPVIEDNLYPMQDSEEELNSDDSDEKAVYNSGTGTTRLLASKDGDLRNIDEVILDHCKIPKPSYKERARVMSMEFCYFERDLDVYTDDEGVEKAINGYPLRELNQPNMKERTRIKSKQLLQNDQTPLPTVIAPEGKITQNFRIFEFGNAPQPENNIDIEYRPSEYWIPQMGVQEEDYPGTTVHPHHNSNRYRKYELTGKYTGDLRYRLSEWQCKKILELRFGYNIDVHSPPKMSQDQIARAVNCHANYVSRFIRRYFMDNDISEDKLQCWYSPHAPNLGRHCQIRGNSNMKNNGNRVRHYVKSGKYAGLLYHSLSAEEQSKIIELRLGPNPQRDSTPKMTVDDIAARLQINANSVGRCIRKFFVDRGWEVQKDCWWWKDNAILQKYSTESFQRSLQNGFYAKTLPTRAHQIAYHVLSTRNQGAAEGIVGKAMTFSTLRVERNNHTGEAKQLEYAAKNALANQKSKERLRQKMQEDYYAAKELVEKGELSMEKFKKHYRLQPERRGKRLAGKIENNTTWSPNEVDAFVIAIKAHGRDWDKVSAAVPTKKRSQCQCKVTNMIMRLEKGLRPWDQKLYDALKYSDGPGRGRKPSGLREKKTKSVIEPSMAERMREMRRQERMEYRARIAKLEPGTEEYLKEMKEYTKRCRLNENQKRRNRRLKREKHQRIDREFLEKIKNKKLYPGLVMYIGRDRPSYDLRRKRHRGFVNFNDKEESQFSLQVDTRVQAPPTIPGFPVTIMSQTTGEERVSMNEPLVIKPSFSIEALDQGENPQQFDAPMSDEQVATFEQGLQRFISSTEQSDHVIRPDHLIKSNDSTENDQNQNHADNKFDRQSQFEESSNLVQEQQSDLSTKAGSQLAPFSELQSQASQQQLVDRIGNQVPHQLPPHMLPPRPPMLLPAPPGFIPRPGQRRIIFIHRPRPPGMLATSPGQPQPQLLHHPYHPPMQPMPPRVAGIRPPMPPPPGHRIFIRGPPPPGAFPAGPLGMPIGHHPHPGMHHLAPPPPLPPQMPLPSIKTGLMTPWGLMR